MTSEPSTPPDHVIMRSLLRLLWTLVVAICALAFLWGFADAVPNFKVHGGEFGIFVSLVLVTFSILITGIFVFMTFRIDRGARLEAATVANETATSVASAKAKETADTVARDAAKKQATTSAEEQARKTANEVARAVAAKVAKEIAKSEAQEHAKSKAEQVAKRELKDMQERVADGITEGVEKALRKKKAQARKQQG